MTQALFALLLVVMIGGCATFGKFFQNSGNPPLIANSAFPPRSGSAMGGARFIEFTKKMNNQQREAAIYKEVSSGNIPNFLRRAQSIRLSSRYGREVLQGTLYVLPDYLAIGSDYDFVRIPMTPVTAQKLGDRFGYSLPTRKLVNEIYRQSAVKLSPSPMRPGRMMMSNQYYLSHQRTIESQLRGRSKNQLIAGQKKDIVITNLLNRLPYRVAIYGWHRLGGQPIQPLSLVHGNTYADYSHGVRLVANIMMVGGRRMFYSDVLKDRKLSLLVSDEGPISRTRAMTIIAH